MAVTQPTTVAAPDGPRYLPAASIRRRARLEQTVYGATALGMTITPHLAGQPAPLTLTAGVIAAGTLYRLYTKASDTLGLIKSAQKALPALTGTGVYLTNTFHPGTTWWEYLLPAGWAITMAAITPLTHAANLHTLHPTSDGDQAIPALQEAPTTAPAASVPTTYAEHRTHQWATARPTGTTQLTTVHQYQDNAPDFWGIVVAEAGETVPDLNPTTLAGIFDLPVGTVTLHLIDGSGPGRKLLQARPTLDTEAATQQDPIHRLFTEKLARPGGGADGMHLTAHRTERNRIALRVTAPDAQMIRLNQKQIARSLGYKDHSLVMVETDGLGDGIVSIYKNHPLQDVREATVDDLTMRPDGTVQIGVRHDGRPARMPLYDPEMGAVTDLFVGAPGAGKSVALLTVLVAERLSGVVSIVADAQNGMSLPEADGRVYHFGKGIAATGATLAAFNELGAYREKISAANGWGSFEIGQPWALVNGTFDELNRILSSDADVPRPFRAWVSGLVSDGQATGRKLGKGIRFAAQNIHLAELGDKDKIRANAKNGTVWLGRTNSSTTQHMATDGVLPPGVTLDPIQRYFKTGSDIDAAFSGQEAQNGPITAGMANIIQGGALFLSRVFRARKENKTYPHLIALMEAKPMTVLTPEEDQVFQDAYARWLPHAEALLAGDTDDEPDYETAGLDDEDDEPTPGSIKDRILDLLADGPQALKDIRHRMPDVAPGSVNNAMAELNQAGHVTPVNRGTYQLAN
ncbi:hypothetical protein [Streptomyces sp. NPDC008150]|uniref:hypothetical protein n=1 Tax=Streptomyces sp. NPDC008150 TaxID=3364816 RepID=UPI0036F149D4